MSEAPERISIYPIEGTWACGGIEFSESDEPEQVEYVRADRIKELEAKLANAVEALDVASMHISQNTHDDDIRLIWGTLAELKGEGRE